MKDKPNWLQKLMIALTVIVFSPLIVVGIIILVVLNLFQIPKNKKKYKSSRYYADLQQRFMTSILYSPEYRFYNSAMRRGLPIKYVKQKSNGFEYFIYNDSIYLFPDFEEIDLNEEESLWQAYYDGDCKPFDECYANLLAKLESAPIYPVRLLVERKAFASFNLNDKDIPDCIFVTRNYENAFENEESPLKMIIPQNSKELYEMMLQTPDLCGTFELAENGENIVWDLYENIRIEISVDSCDCYLEVSKLSLGKIAGEITHWHPTVFEIYDEACSIGKRGNVTVLRSNFMSGILMYSGSKADCPYAPDKKYLFGKYYYLEAK